MRSVAGRAAFGLERRVLERERPLLTRMALDARRVRTYREPRLFELKAAVRVVAVTAFHRTFQHFVVERLAELRLGLCMAAHAKLRLARL